MLRGLVGSLLNVILPRACFICERTIDEGVLCHQCQKKIKPFGPKPKALLRTHDIHTGKIKEDAAGTHRVIVALRYEEPLITLVHRFKYQHFEYLADVFSEYMCQAFLRCGFRPSDFDCIICVPSLKATIRERGYNQSRLLALGVGHRLGMPFIEGALSCTVSRPSQTTLDAEARHASIQGAFCVRMCCEHKRILLVDDIVTTGATVTECIHILQDADAAGVSVLALAGVQ